MVIDLWPSTILSGRLFRSKRHLKQDLNSNMGSIMISGRHCMSCAKLAWKINQSERKATVIEDYDVDNFISIEMSWSNF